MSAAALTLLALLATAPRASAQAWDRFRGPDGSGVASDARALPSRLDPKTNLLRSADLWRGNSSPCVSAGRVFVTGEREGELETVCFDLASGALRWRRALRVAALERHHEVNSAASATPAADGERVLVYFASLGLLCYDFEGEGALVVCI